MITVARDNRGPTQALDKVSAIFQRIFSFDPRAMATGQQKQCQPTCIGFGFQILEEMNTQKPRLVLFETVALFRPLPLLSTSFFFAIE